MLGRRIRGKKALKKKGPNRVSNSSPRKKSRRRPTLPHGFPCSTIGSEELNFRVRDGIGCGLLEITTGNCGYPRFRLCLSVSKKIVFSKRVLKRELRKPNPGCELHAFGSRSYEVAIGANDVCLRDMVKPHDLLVLVNSATCVTSIPSLSTLWSTRGL